MVEKIKFEPASLAEAKQMIFDMFMSNEIGTYGDRNWNGADSYHCPACYASKQIMGYCSSVLSHNEVEHRDDCKQDASYRWVMSDDPEGTTQEVKE